MLLMAAGDRCPASGIASGLARAARRRGTIVPPPRGSAAVARARAAAALTRARKLFLRTNFAGCVSLLSITEQELGREVADADEARGQRAHRILAQVNLWLGVCQWSAGDPQAAAASFVRSAQLPSSPLPDDGLFPPALVAAYRRALRRSRQEVSCAIEAPLIAGSLLIDGKGPTLRGGAVQVPVGTHYVVLGACDPRRPACLAIWRRMGASGPRAMRLDAKPLACTIRIPARGRGVTPAPCVSRGEASDPRFVADVLREARASLAVAVTLPGSGRRLSLRLLHRGEREFTRQLHISLGVGKSLPAAVERLTSLLVAVELPVASRSSGPATRRVDPLAPGFSLRPRPWYGRWWIWASVGAVVVGAITAVALSARSDNVRVVFGP